MARQGTYSNEAVEALPAAWRVNYLKKLDSNQSTVVDKIKDEVIFRRLNLMDERFPVSKEVSCDFLPQRDDLL